MVRDLDRLTERTFDVLVVGGGICGLMIAYDAALRGLAVALVERDDFGSGSTFNHQRTIHGGLRHLQRLDIRRARESVRERSTFARIAPHTVRPLPFVVPIYRSLLAGKLAMRAGFLLYRLVSIGANRHVPASLRLAGGRIVSRGDAAHHFPGLRRRGLTAAGVWQDYVTVESDRLTFTVALAAHEHGAALANHAEAVALLRNGQTVTGVRARDQETGREIEIAARLTVNATAAAVDRLLAPIGLATKMPLVKAMNLVTRRDAGDEALGGRAPSGRFLMLVPWRGRIVAGTWESAQLVTDTTQISQGDVDAFIDELNHAFPALDLKADDVTLVHQGLVPAAQDASGRVRPGRSDRMFDHSRDGVEGLLSVAATKYTTSRALAERAVDLIVDKLKMTAAGCRTATTILPGGSVRDVANAIADARRDHDADLPSDAIPHLVQAYGSRYRDILEIAANRPGWRARLTEESPVIGAQLVWAARKEMALTLADAVIRRTPLGALGCPPDGALESAAAIVGTELGWSEDRRLSEIATVKRFYVLQGTLNPSNT